MLDKSRLIAITKCDLLDEELMNEIEKDIKKSINIEFIFISSISNIGLSELKDKVWEMLN
jgi:GTP-binding protein